MRKTANYRVIRLSRFCTDPEVAEIKMRKAIGWGVQLQRRMVRKIKDIPKLNIWQILSVLMIFCDSILYQGS